ncbi:MAG: hypothetical protein JWN71_1014 [Xanthobacteraceae bacterium]|nr:hypothetical protein [Xanthobacteraceae bacterium]
MQADLERFWARLLTEPDFRARFIADPAGFAAQNGLSPEECDAVVRTQVQDLHTAARSYAAKNAGKRPRSSDRWWRRWLPFKAL